MRAALCMPVAGDSMRRVAQFPLRSPVGVQWAEALSMLEVPGRHLLRLWPGLCPPVFLEEGIERELMGASLRIWQAIAGGVSVHEAANRERDAFAGVTYSRHRDRRTSWASREPAAVGGLRLW